jgi:hypothetical protein
MAKIWDLVPPYDRDEFADALVEDVNRNVAMYQEEVKKENPDKSKLVEFILLKLGRFNEKYPLFLHNHIAKEILQNATAEPTGEKYSWKTLKKFTLPCGKVLFEKVQGSEKSPKTPSRVFLKLVDENGNDIPKTVWTETQKIGTLNLVIGTNM